MSAKPKVVAVVGPTASGKTSLSIDIAKAHNGEVISADSRQVYKGLDIGSGKVTAEEMSGVPHHLLDVVEPSTLYTGADFKRDATAALEDILERNRLPIVAGGTFFYLDLLRNKLSSAPVSPNPALRATLEHCSTEELFSKLSTLDPTRAADIDAQNRHRLIRALEIVEVLGYVPKPTTHTSQYEWLIIGIDIDSESLQKNIHSRLLSRMQDGMLDEVEQLHKHGLHFERMEELGLEYRYLARHLKGDIGYETMLRELEVKIRQFAKRQKTWLKRDEAIHWFKPEERADAISKVGDFISA
jgi:tRNA dimethylallyltransferase